MKKLNPKKLTSLNAFLLSGVVVVLLFIGSCNSGGEDPVPDPTPKPTTDEMYIILNGQKVICKIPATDYKTYIHPGTGDTSFRWAGNIPSGVGGDTTIHIRHAGPRLVGIKYKVDKPIAAKADEVGISIQWSIVDGKPSLNIDGGDYTLEKVKGKWVSTLKNGTGYDVKISGKKYTGIEFRIIWP